MNLKTIFCILFLFRIQILCATESLELTLSDALILASKQNVNVLIAHQRVAQAVSDIEISRAGLYPQVNGIVSSARQTRDLRSSGVVFPGLQPEIGPFNSFDARAQLSIQLFDLETLNRLKSAKARKTLSNAQLIKISDDILALTAYLYLTAKNSKGHLDSLQIILNRDSFRLQKAKQQFEKGVLSKVDMMFSQSQFWQSRFMYQQAKQQALEDQLNLLAILNLEDQDHLIFKNGPLLRVDTSEGTSPRLIESQAQLNFAQAQTALASVGYAPKISGIADIGYAGQDINHDSRIYTLGIKATFPFWLGGLTQAQEKKAKTKEMEEQLHLKDVTRQVHFDTIASQHALYQAKMRVYFRRVQREAVNESTRIVKQKVLQGLADQMKLREALAEKSISDDQYEQALALLQMAHITLAHAKGLIAKMIVEK